MNKAFLRPRLCGGRFTDGGIPLDILPDLRALQALVAKIARSEYLRENPTHHQVPAGFDKSLSLKLTGIEQGSAVAEISFDESAPPLPGFEHRFEKYALKAADKIHDCIAAGQDGRDLPGHLPRQSFGDLEKFGSSLRGNERIEFPSPGRQLPATLTQETRSRLLERLKVQVERKPVTARGCIPELDHDRRKFEFWPTGGSKISIPIPDLHRQTVLDAFNGYWQSAKVSLTGIGIVTGDGNLKRVESIQELQMLAPLDVDAQIDELTMLSDGWLDGEGVAPSRVGLQWLAAKFAALYPCDLRRPHLYPTPEGGVQAEWSIHDHEMDLTVDLERHRGIWDEAGPRNHTYTLDLNLDSERDWESFGGRVRAMQDRISERRD